MGVRTAVLDLATADLDGAHGGPRGSVTAAANDDDDDADCADADADVPSPVPHHWGFEHGRPPSTWVKAAAADGLSVLHGTFETGGQKHFFLETHSTLAVPCEDGKMTLTCGMQAPTVTQHCVAAALGLPMHRVDVRCRRVGGAYGGKLSHHIPTAVVTALAAHKLRRPVRVHNERAADMAATGGRAPFVAQWSAAADPKSGVISSVSLEMTFESGCVDGATGDLGMALGWSDNCYRHADFAAKGSIALSHKVGNTSVRAPGVIASIPLHECVLEAVASQLRLPADAVREANMYVAGDVTPPVCGGITLGKGGFNWTVPTMWTSSKAAWQVDARRTAIEAYNAANRWRKRGLCLLPIKYPFDTTYFKMASAVRVLGLDGSVHVVHGGCELGQGIHTKVAQAVAHALGCPLGAITIGDTSTLESPNSNGTGGSGGSESCVRSVLDACAKLSRTLKPYRKPTWQATIAAAYDAHVSLHATGWESVGADAQPKKFDYATQGVGCVEVEVDALTGEIAILRADVCMDQGTPLNPLIDLGQVEGGFMMALGYFLTEEVSCPDR